MVDQIHGLPQPRKVPRWALWKRVRVTNADGEVYLDRLRIVQTPLFSVFLHKMTIPDPGNDLHDHPWPFASIILRGGYEEERGFIRDRGNGFSQVCVQGSVHGLRLDDTHRITKLLRVPTWTLVFTGRRSRTWGFYVNGKWIPSEVYAESESMRVKVSDA